MMGWFFSRKSVSNEKFDELVNSIKLSFSNVKKDISSFKEKQLSNETQIGEIQNILAYLNKSLSLIYSRLELLEKLNQKKENITIYQNYNEIDDKNPIPRLQSKDVLNKITSVQEEMIEKLAALNRESKSKLIAAKDLAQEMYPETEYSKVRPMISNYLDILEELGLIKKIRKRRQVFIELTEKGKFLTESSPSTKIKISRISRNAANKRKKI